MRVRQHAISASQQSHAASVSSTSKQRRQQTGSGAVVIGVDAYLYVPYLSRNTDQQQPLLLRVRTIVYDLTAGEARVTIKHFLWLRVTYKYIHVHRDSENNKETHTPQSCLYLHQMSTDYKALAVCVKLALKLLFNFTPYHFWL